ncbi:MAG: hypothetical protein HY822_09075 [Acidobacteria bacterium]|nr:hypothetical protein [Acidobacteriota bacterium]
MKKLLLTFLLGAFLLSAQTPGPGRPFSLFPPELQKYLELTGTQVDAINRANLEFNFFVTQKQMRVAMVQAEIRHWTNADPIDAMQLGVRHAELEQIRREIGDEERKTTAKVRGVLTFAQQAKLKVLEDALKLQPLINDAACERLIGGQAGCIRAAIMPGPVDPGPRP